MTLSVVVYGRNDSHGYNMHKRVAISLNCIAELLTHENDEILYVDYNSSDDLPTIIEAIQDTLTDKAKKLTRVFRVRSKVHKQFQNKTHAQVNEPLSRNIAIRRSNPKNKWILSTNTDMVFTPLDQTKSLSDIVNEAQNGFYELARFEVPEPLWESLDRKNPIDIISKFKTWGKSLHLNEVVYGNDIIIYDAPGDFQLMLRDDIFAISGFDEKMIFGWHVDSNLCKRMWLHHGKIGSLQDKLYGYHCNHTRVSGWMHSVRRKKENSTETFFDKITIAEIPEQSDNWGLAGEEVEEIKIGSDLTSNFLSYIQKIIPDPLNIEFTESSYNHEGYNEILYSTYHVIPYLFEQILLLKKSSNIVYIGHNPLMLEKLQQFCNISNTQHNLYRYQHLPASNEKYNHYQKYKINSDVTLIELDQINDKADLLIFDFGLDDKTVIKRSYLEALHNILNCQDLILQIIGNKITKDAIKAISIKVHNTTHYRSVRKFFNIIQNPFNTHILVGYNVNNKKNMKEVLYSNYFRENILYLMNENNILSFLFLVPFYGLWFGLRAAVIYKLKPYALRRRIKRNQIRLNNILKI